MTLPLHPKKKVTIVIDAAAVEAVVGVVDAAGAKGYTIVRGVTGKGHRGLRRGHDVFDEAQNVLLVIVADEAVARRVLEGAIRLLERHAGVAYVEDVEVARGDLF